MNRVSLSVKEVAGYFKVCERQARRIIKQYDHFSVNGRGGKAGKQLRVYVDSLPLYIRRLYEQDHPSKNGKQKPHIPARAYKVAEWRLDILTRAEEVEASAGSGQRKKALIRFCREEGISYNTYVNWKKSYKKQGLDGLYPNFGNSKNGAIPREVADFIRSEYLQPSQPSVQTIISRSNEFCKKNGFSQISRYKIERIIKEIPESLLVLRRIGRNAFNDKFGFYIERDWSKCRVNEVWCGDHRQFDIFVYQNENRKRILAPWLTFWMDMRSRALVGWYISLCPNSDTIALSFRHAVLRCGLPETIYVDNGKDYTSKYFGGKSRRLGKIDFDLDRLSILTRMGINKINALPYNHRAKPIESLCRTIALRFDRNQPGWRGPDTASKPEKLNFEKANGKLLTIDEFIANFEREFVVWYNEKKQHCATGEIPVSFYEDARVVMPSRMELDFLLMKRKDVEFRRRGIRANGLWYFSEELFAKKLVSERLEIRWDPRDISEVLVFDENGFVCRCPAQHPVDARGMSEREWAQMKRIMKTQRETMKRATQFLRSPSQQQQAGAEIKENNRIAASSDPAPVAKNTLKLVTREALLAKQIKEAEPSCNGPDELRKTGTDDELDMSFVQPYFDAMKKKQREEKELDMSFIGRFKK